MTRHCGHPRWRLCGAALPLGHPAGGAGAQQCRRVLQGPPGAAGCSPLGRATLWSCSLVGCSLEGCAHTLFFFPAELTAQSWRCPQQGMTKASSVCGKEQTAALSRQIPRNRQCHQPELAVPVAQTSGVAVKVLSVVPAEACGRLRLGIQLCLLRACAVVHGKASSQPRADVRVMRRLCARPPHNWWVSVLGHCRATLLAVPSFYRESRALET